MTLRDSVLDASGAAPGTAPVGATVVNGRPPESVALTLDRVTIVGNGDPDSAAMLLYGQGGALPTSLRARHVAVADFGRTFLFGHFGSDTSATVDHSNLDLSPAAIAEDPGSTVGNAITAFGPGNLSGDPLFVDPAVRDYRLKPDSPAIDIGGDDLLAGDATDLGGAPRPTDGDGDGIVANDAGAFEHQFVAGPASEFEIIRVKRNKRKGTAKITAMVPGAGELALAKTIKLKGASKSSTKAQKLKLKVRPRGKARRRLLRAGAKRAKLTARAKLTFTPVGGTASKQSRRIVLVRKARS